MSSAFTGFPVVSRHPLCLKPTRTRTAYEFIGACRVNVLPSARPARTDRARPSASAHLGISAGLTIGKNVHAFETSGLSFRTVAQMVSPETDLMMYPGSHPPDASQQACHFTSTAFCGGLRVDTSKCSEGTDQL